MEYVELASGQVMYGYDYSTPISGALSGLSLNSPKLADSFAEARVQALNILVKRAYEDSKNSVQSKVAVKELKEVIAKFKDEITIDLESSPSSSFNTDTPDHYLEITEQNLINANNIQLYQGWRYSNILNESNKLDVDYPMYDEFERIISTRDPFEFLQDIGWPTDSDALYKDRKGDVFKFKNLHRYNYETPEDFQQSQDYLVGIIGSFKPNLGTNIALRDRINKGIEWLEKWRQDHPKKKKGWDSLVFPNGQLLSDRIVLPPAGAEFHELTDHLNAKNGLTYEIAMEYHIKMHQELLGRPHPKQLEALENLGKATATKDHIVMALRPLKEF